MDADGETLKNICCTCLSYDRKLTQLIRVRDGIDILGWLLSFTSEVVKESTLKIAMNMSVCWECEALFNKITRFRYQACAAQKQFLSAIKELDVINPSSISLSRLSYISKPTYDRAYTHNDEINFIDCGSPTEIKTELADEDIGPLSFSDIENTDYKNNTAESSQIIQDSMTVYSTTDNVNEKPDTSMCAQIKIIQLKSESGTTGESQKVADNRKTLRKCFRVVKLSHKIMTKARELAKTAPGFVNAKFKCKTCILCFDDESQLVQHNKDRHSKTANCPICNSYIDEACLNAHITEHYKSYRCEKCAFKTESYNDVFTHSRNCILIGKNMEPSADFMCQDCGMSFDSYRKLWKHTNRMHSGPHQCSECDEEFSSKSKLVKHSMMSHGTKRPRKKCPTCMKMVRIDIWKQHMLTHTQRASHWCEDCNKKFVCRASYANHLKFARAHAVKDYLVHKCASCEKAFRRASELQDHINFNHNGRTRHKCPVCEKPLSTKRGITRHINRAHKGIKENAKNKICQLCGLTFYTKKSLLEHELIHSGERPLSCDICDRTFRQRASLYTHRRRVHNIVNAKKKTVEAV